MNTENFSRKLINKYSTNSSKVPTPCQIKQNITQIKFINDLSKLTGIENKYELEKTFVRKDKPLTDDEKVNLIMCLNEFKKNDPDAYLKFKLENREYIKEIIGEINASRVNEVYENFKKR